MIMNMFETSKVVEIFLKYDISNNKDETAYFIKELEGITNHSFIVEVDGKQFVLRIPGDNPDEINRNAEKNNTLLVQELELTLPYLVFDEVSGVKISEYFEIYTYKESDFLNEQLRNAAFLSLKKLHNSDLNFMENFSPLKVFRNLADSQNSLEIEAVEVGNNIVAKLEEIGLQRKPCHQDLYSGNFVIYKDKTFLIDWEYSSLGDPYFDYADLFWQNEIDDENLQGRYLKELGFSKTEEITKFKLFQTLSMITWGLWAKRKSPFDNKGDEALLKAIKNK